MRQNVGEFDRAVRGALGIWLIVVGIAARTQNQNLASLISLLAGAGLLQNALTGFCGGNWLFRIDTTATDDDTDLGE